MGIGLRFLPESAAVFEEHGFESGWLPEHLVIPERLPNSYPYSEGGQPPFTAQTPAYDPWVLHSAIAEATSTIRLGTNVFILPLRHPLQTARSVVTLDRVSRGRVTLGVGIGWLRDEYDYLGIPWSERGRRLDQTVRILRDLWSEGSTEVRDGYFDFGPTDFRPKPYDSAGIPIEIGGTAPVALRRAGEIGDGWIETGSATLDEFASRVAVIQEARAGTGRQGHFEITVCGPLAEQPAAYRALEELGATRVVVNPYEHLEGRRPTIDDAREWAKRFADQVMARQ